MKRNKSDWFVTLPLFEIVQIKGGFMMGERKGASRNDRELVELIQNDDAQATHDLFEKKQKLIETWADKFQKTFGNCGRIVNREDFVQAGNLGLLCAAKEFDLDKGTEFSIIAERMIRQMMAMELLNDGLGRVLSINEVIEMQKVLDVDEKYQNEMDQEKRMLSVSSDLKLSVERVKKLLALYAQYFKTESLDASDFERREECLADNNPQDHEKHFEPVMDNERKKAIAKVLMDLKPRERDVIIKLYGLEDGRPRSLEDIGCDYGVTRERIRQIAAKALRKLRNPERSKYIKDFLPDC